MPVLKPLFAMAALGQGLYGKFVFKRVVTGVILVITLTIIIAMLLGAMLIGGFYAAYAALLAHGFDLHSTLLILGASVIILISLLVGAGAYYLRRLQDARRKLLRINLPISTRLNEAVDSFLDGLLTPPLKE